MTPSNTPDARPSRHELAAQLSKELILLRNALVSLSISLKDWKFEVDQSGKKASQKIVTEVLNKCRLQHPGEVNAGQELKPSATKD
jgi:hypothetical protein